MRDNKKAATDQVSDYLNIQANHTKIPTEKEIINSFGGQND